MTTSPPHLGSEGTVECYVPSLCRQVDAPLKSRFCAAAGRPTPELDSGEIRLPDLAANAIWRQARRQAQFPLLRQMPVIAADYVTTGGYNESR